LLARAIKSDAVESHDLNEQSTRRPLTILFALSFVLALYGCAGARAPDADPRQWHAYALMQTLNAELLASRSATATLRSWCAQHHLAATPEIVAEVLQGSVPATSEQRARLMVTADESIRYRRVRLRCGSRIMSEAENWYVPARLTAEMNRQLDGSQAPFGRVIESLEPYRRNFHMQVHWPMPGREQQASAAAAVMFEHRAIVHAGNHQPLAEVREIYQSTALP
jgi:chorismate-pyruvate lyase